MPVFAMRFAAPRRRESTRLKPMKRVVMATPTLAPQTTGSAVSRVMGSCAELAAAREMTRPMVAVELWRAMARSAARPASPTG